jgi:hypothetical protein
MIRTSPSVPPPAKPTPQPGVLKLAQTGGHLGVAGHHAGHQLGQGRDLRLANGRLCRVAASVPNPSSGQNASLGDVLAGIALALALAPGPRIRLHDDWTAWH